MFAEDFIPKPEPCPTCGKVLTDGKDCISCNIDKDTRNSYKWKGWNKMLWSFAKPKTEEQLEEIKDENKPNKINRNNI